MANGPYLGYKPISIKIKVDTTQFPQWIQRFPQALKHALKDEADDIFAASQRIVPVKTGALRNSGRVEESEPSPGTFKVTIGYGDPATYYAIRVHEDPHARHAKPTQWKYLETPMVNAQRTMQGRRARRAKDFLNAQGITSRNAAAQSPETFGGESP